MTPGPPRLTVVDGYNVLHAVSRLRRLLEERGQAVACRALVDVCVRWCASGSSRGEVVLVLDGARPLGEPVRPADGLSVRYMLDGADADVMRLLERRGEHTLVSADDELVQTARRLAHDVEAPRAFFSRVLEEAQDSRERHERERSVSDAELQGWLEVFEGSPSRAPGARTPTQPVQAPREVDEQAKEPPLRPAVIETSQLATEGEGLVIEAGELADEEVQDWLEYFGEGGGAGHTDSAG